MVVVRSAPGDHPPDDLERALGLLAPGWSYDHRHPGTVDEQLAFRARTELSRRINALARTAGALIVETAAIERAGHTVLLLGPSGSGKTTLALRARDRGWRIIGDEACWLAPDGLWAIGVRGQSRSVLADAPRFGDRWLFETVQPALRRIGWPHTIIALAAPDISSARRRLMALVTVSSDPAQIGAAGVERLYALGQRMTWMPASDFDHLVAPTAGA